jgi:hypothetical protein
MDELAPLQVTVLLTRSTITAFRSGFAIAADTSAKVVWPSGVNRKGFQTGTDSPWTTALVLNSLRAER